MRFNLDDPQATAFCSFEVAAAAAAGGGTAAGVAGTAAGLGAAVGPGTALGVTAAASGASSVFTFSNILTTFSAISQIAGGFMQAQELETQAELENLRARSELLEGQRQVIEEKEQLVLDLAAFRAQQGGRGVSVSDSGSVQAAIDAAVSDSEFQTDISRTGARIRAASRRTSASVLRGRASGARLSGLAGAAATVAGRVDRNARRGA